LPFLAVEESSTSLLLAWSHQHLSPVPPHDVGAPSQEDLMNEEEPKTKNSVTAHGRGVGLDDL